MFRRVSKASGSWLPRGVVAEFAGFQVLCRATSSRLRQQVVRRQSGQSGGSASGFQRWGTSLVRCGGSSHRPGHTSLPLGDNSVHASANSLLGVASLFMPDQTLSMPDPTRSTPEPTLSVTDTTGTIMETARSTPNQTPSASVQTTSAAPRTAWVLENEQFGWPPLVSAPGQEHSLFRQSQSETATHPTTWKKPLSLGTARTHKETLCVLTPA